MDPATIAADISLISSVISLLVQAGKAVVEMVPEIAMFFQVIGGTPLTADQQASLNTSHAALTAAATAPLPEAPSDAT